MAADPRLPLLLSIECETIMTDFRSGSFPDTGSFRRRGPAPAPGLACLLVTAGVLLGMAGSARAEVRMLTLEDALRIAAEENKDILKAKEYRKKVLGRYIEEKANAMPQLFASSSFSRDSDNSQKAFGGGFFMDMPVTRNLYTAEVGVSQVLFTWGQVGAALRAAREGIEDAEAQLAIYQQAVARDVTAAFYDTLLAKEMWTLAEENRRQKSRHLEETRKKYETGTATDYDILAAQVTLSNAQPEVIRSENLIRTSREQLRFLLGLEGQEIDTTGSLNTEVRSNPDFDRLLPVALRSRPDLHELEHQEAMTRELYKVYQAGNKPRLDFRGGSGWRKMTIGEGTADGLAYSAGVYLTFPFYDSGRTAGRLMQVRSDLEQLRLQKAKSADGISLQLRQGIHAVREAGEILQALTGTTVQADKLLSMAEKGYEFGVKTRLEVEEAQLNLRLAKSNVSRARRDYLVSLATLDWITGTIRTAP